MVLCALASSAPCPSLLPLRLGIPGDDTDSFSYLSRAVALVSFVDTLDARVASYRCRVGAGSGALDGRLRLALRLSRARLSLARPEAGCGAAGRRWPGGVERPGRSACVQGGCRIFLSGATFTNIDTNTSRRTRRREFTRAQRPGVYTQVRAAPAARGVAAAWCIGAAAPCRKPYIRCVS